jgi:methylated-DNA-[protein]-cysteine S-methyltransferase
MTYYTLKKTPAGTVLLIGDGKVVTGLHWKVFSRTPKIHPDWIENEKKFAQPIRQLEQYFARKRKSFDFAYEVNGTEFQKKVWKQLEKISHGMCVSYAEIAKAIGKPGSVRAVGTAVGSNPISIVVPCHRVLTSAKKLGGFAGGLPAKKMLLKGEGIAWVG